MKLLTNYSEYRTATFRIKSASWVVIECEWIFRNHFRQQQLIIFLIINNKCNLFLKQVYNTCISTCICKYNNQRPARCNQTHITLNISI